MKVFCGRAQCGELLGTVGTSILGSNPNPVYEFWILRPGASWTVARAYSGAAGFSWNTSGLGAGGYRYSVWVRDAGSSAAYDAYLPGAAYTVT